MRQQDEVKRKSNNTLGLLGCMVVLLSACGSDDVIEADTEVLAADKLPKISTIALAAQEYVPTIATVGEVKAAEQIELSVDFSSPVARVLVDDGQAVKRGDLLLELDPTKLQLRLNQAMQSLQQAESRLKEAKDNYKRREVLAKQNNLSEEALEASRHEQQRSLAEVAEAKAAKDLAQRDLDDTRVISPADGVVDKRLVETGETVQPGQQLLVLQATETLEVETWVSERDVNSINEGAPALVTISGWQSNQYKAEVQSIGAAGHSNTGNFAVKLLLTERDSDVRPGMAAQIEIQGSPLKDVILLPESALADRQRQRVVFVYNPETGKVNQREPQLIAGFSDQLIVKAGLETGEQVVVGGVRSLVDGASVDASAE